MSRAMLADVLNFTGTALVVQFHWYWMTVALVLGVWVGWRTAAEKPASLSEPTE